MECNIAVALRGVRRANNFSQKIISAVPGFDVTPNAFFCQKIHADIVTSARSILTIFDAGTSCRRGVEDAFREADDARDAGNAKIFAAADCDNTILVHH